MSEDEALRSWRRAVMTRALLFVAFFTVLSVTAISALWWALAQSQDTVAALSSASQCRSEVAQEEAAALNDVIIRLFQQSTGGPEITDSERTNLIVELENAQARRRLAVERGCDETLVTTTTSAP